MQDTIHKCQAILDTMASELEICGEVSWTTNQRLTKTITELQSSLPSQPEEGFDIVRQTGSYREVTPSPALPISRLVRDAVIHELQSAYDSSESALDICSYLEDRVIELKNINNK